MFASEAFGPDDNFNVVDIGTQHTHQLNLYKALDELNGYDEFDAAMLNYVLDQDTYCYENYSRKDDICWMNTRTRETHNLDINVLADSITVLLAYKGHKREIAIARLRKKRKYAIFAYNPYTTQIEFANNNKRCFNTYLPPKWKLRNYKPELPVIIDEFMKRLFPKDDSREYVYDWLANGLKNRNLTYLLLLSTQGAGKGIFSNLVKALYGHGNCAFAGQTFIDKEFNANIKNKQILVLNEITAKEPEDLDKLKTLVDDTIVIEGKHVDSAECQNHLNVIITINRPDAIEIEDNDRRYSIVHLSQKALKDQGLTAKQIQDYAEMHYNDDIVGQFGQWLMQRNITRNMLHKYVDEDKMHEINEELMYGWQKFIFNEVCQYNTKLTNPFTSKDLNDLMKETGLITRDIGWNKIYTFINNKCGHILRCCRNKENPALLDIEFIHPRKAKDDGIQF